MVEAPTYGSGPASLVRSLRRHPLLVALVTVAAVAAAALWLASRSTSYEATAEILVTPAPDDSGPDRGLPLLRTSGDRTRVVQTAASLIESAGAAQRTADTLGGDWTRQRVDDAVTVAPVGQTDVVAVTAEADSSALAVRLANSFARSALDARAEVLRPRITTLRTQLQQELRSQTDPGSQAAVDIQERLSELNAIQAGGDPTLSLSRRAVAPASSVGTAAWLVLAVALVAGLLVGAGAAMVIDLIGPQTVADAGQASALAKAPVLARLRMPRPGRSPPPAVVRAARTLEVQLLDDASSLLIVSASAGGEAAACAEAFGAALERAGRNVLVLDVEGGDEVPAGAERTRYDYVLVHAGWFIESAEAAAAARSVDSIALVVRARHTTVEDVDLTLRLLDRAGSRPDAVILVTGPRLPWSRLDRREVVEVADADIQGARPERAEAVADEHAPPAPVTAGDEDVVAGRGPRDKRVSRRHA